MTILRLLPLTAHWMPGPSPAGQWRCAGWAVILAILPLRVLAAESTTKSFDLKADVAEKSLKVFSRQAGLEVIFPSEIAKDVRTKPVKGKMTARQALGSMLEDTGLALLEDETGAFTVRREGHDPNAARAALPKGSDRPQKVVPPAPAKNPPKA